MDVEHMPGTREVLHMPLICFKKSPAQVYYTLHEIGLRLCFFSGLCLFLFCPADLFPLVVLAERRKVCHVPRGVSSCSPWQSEYNEGSGEEEEEDEGEGSSDEGSSDSDDDDESLADESDEDEEYNDVSSDEEEGLSWDELEERAKKGQCVIPEYKLQGAVGQARTVLPRIALPGRPDCPHSRFWWNCIEAAFVL